MKKIMTFVISLLMVAIVLTSCRSKEPSRTENQDVSVNQTEDATMEDIVENTGMTIKTDMGETGSNLTLPTDFPKDVVPLMSDANIVNVNGAGTKSIGVVFKTEKSFDEAVAFYKNVMKDGKLDMDVNQETSYILMGNKADYTVMITISKYDGEKISVLLNTTSNS